MASKKPATWRATDVDVTTVERAIPHLWAQMTGEEESRRAVRTAVLNLVVYTDSMDVAQHVAGQLDEMRGRRPSRVIILVSDRLCSECTVDAEVSVICHDRTQSGGALCSERLIVTAHGRAADHVASIVIPLLLPELPTYLLWPGQPPFRHRMFRRLLAMADQVVIDSSQFRSPGDGFADVSQLCAGEQGVNDFHWARLTPWREIIAQFFDSPSCLPYLSHVRSLRIEFGTGGNAASVTSGTLLLLGWMASHLGWTPETTLDGLATRDLTLAVLHGERLIPIDLRFSDRGEGAAGRLMAIELWAQPPGEPPARFSVERTDDLQHARVITAIQEGQEINRVVPLGLKTDVELLGDELDLAGHDRLYEVVVEMAGQLAGREAWVVA